MVSAELGAAAKNIFHFSCKYIETTYAVRAIVKLFFGILKQVKCLIGLS
jgi:hypothetical protein